MKVITAICIIVLFNLRELLQSKEKGKIMAIYFSFMGASLALGILISIDKQPTSLTIMIMDFVKAFGWGEG
nr:hypothetical protein [Pseudobacteroides cellulosolvens]